MDSRLPGDEDGLAPDRDVAAAEQRGLIATAGATLVPFVLLAAWARLASPAPWEPVILDAASLGHDPLADIAVAINVLGNLPVWAVLVAILAAGALALRRIVAAALISLSLASDLAAFVVKLLVERQRPETAAEEHALGFDSFAFPSGHVVRAVALVAVLAWLAAPTRVRLPAAVIGGLGAGLVMGYARVALNVHWPTDAIGGALLGIGWFSLSVLVLDRTRRPRRT